MTVAWWDPNAVSEDDAGGEEGKARLQALLDEWKSQARDRATAADQTGARAAARQDVDRANEAALRKSVHDAYLAVAQSSLDRSIQRATFLVTAASAIVTLYTGALGLAFGTGEHNTPLPARGVVPALFLGLANVLSTVYVAFLKRDTVKIALLPSGASSEMAEVRLRTFIYWSLSSVLNRSWALRGATVAMGFGVATLPVAFLDISGVLVFLILLIGVALVFAAVLAFKPRPGEKEPEHDPDVLLPEAALLEVADVPLAPTDSPSWPPRA